MKITLSIDLEQNLLPYEGILLIEDDGRVWRTTILANSHEKLREYGKVVAEQYRNGGLVNVD